MKNVTKSQAYTPLCTHFQFFLDLSAASVGTSEAQLGTLDQKKICLHAVFFVFFNCVYKLYMETKSEREVWDGVDMCRGGIVNILNKRC